jgi:uncharacterized protein YkuJ
MMMNSPEKELSNNLKEVTEIYLRISDMEERKQKAILERNGKELENLSYLQDNHVVELNILEEKRETAIKLFCEKHSIAYNPSHTLKELLQNVKTNEAAELLEQAESLKNLLLKLANTREINSTLLEDNMKYFNDMLDELKYTSSPSMGYGSNGKVNDNYNAPLFLNRTT